MTADAGKQPVRVTAEQRLHPAIQKLARACIALARWYQERERAAREAREGEPISVPRLREVSSADGTAADRRWADD
jgi:hypothetical protein